MRRAPKFRWNARVDVRWPFRVDHGILAGPADVQVCVTGVIVAFGARTESALVESRSCFGKVFAVCSRLRVVAAGGQTEVVD